MQGNATTKRVLACSEEMVREYLDGVAEELIDCGIFTGAKKVEPGVWTGEIDTTRIFNHDEMPQFIDYGVSSNAYRAPFYCGKGERCQKMKDENRECVTIQPYVNFAGEVIMGHVIFPGTCISRNTIKILKWMISMITKNFGKQLNQYLLISGAKAAKLF